jgi:hypothetical protein
MKADFFNGPDLFCQWLRGRALKKLADETGGVLMEFNRKNLLKS